jgi:conjugative transposon TraK protein
MMFRQMKNIDIAFRAIRTLCVLFLLACVAVCGYVLYLSHQVTLKAQDKVFILTNGKVLEAYAADRKDNIPVEARDHVKTFHHYFFTLDPDDKVIQSNMTKALYLADRSAKQQYDNLKENGYYSNLISGNISQQVEMDSIQVNMDAHPIYFRYYGKQNIIRPTSVTSRSLITEGYLRSMARSDNNPHGFLIERWQTLQNKDLNTKNR